MTQILGSSIDVFGGSVEGTIRAARRAEMSPERMARYVVGSVGIKFAASALCLRESNLALVAAGRQPARFPLSEQLELFFAVTHTIDTRRKPLHGPRADHLRKFLRARNPALGGAAPVDLFSASEPEQVAPKLHEAVEQLVGASAFVRPSPVSLAFGG